ncbi:MAG: ABC transporter substrate-binding protein [Gammaproteobacteria bacterium]
MKKLLTLLLTSMLFFSAVALAENIKQSTEKLEKVTVILDWFVNPDHAPLFVAQEQGYYRAQGLDVKFITPANPTDAVKLVSVGKADIGIDYQPHLLLEITQGLPLVQVGTLIATPLNCLAVLASSQIRNLRSLKDKKIGYSTGDIEKEIFQAMLENQGLNLKNIQWINVSYDLTQALLTKKVDAVVGLMRNFEPIQLQLAGHPAQVFYPEENGMPPYDELIYITRHDKRDDPRINRFLAATEQGVQHLVNYPESSWQIFAEQHPELNNELNRRAWFATLPRFALRPAAKDPQRCEVLAQYLARTMKMKIDVNQVCSY